MVSPGLLAHPAPPSPALDHLKRGEIIGMVVESHERAWSEQLENGRGVLVRHALQMGPMGRATTLVGSGWLLSGHVPAGGLD